VPKLALTGDWTLNLNPVSDTFVESEERRRDLCEADRGSRLWLARPLWVRAVHIVRRPDPHGNDYCSSSDRSKLSL